MRARRRASALVRQPWNVLVPLVFLQWLLLLLLTRRIEHDRWLFTQDGAGTSFWSTAWSLAHGHLPPPLVGFAWPLLLAPLAAIRGANYLDAPAGARPAPDARRPAAHGRGGLRRREPDRRALARLPRAPRAGSSSPTSRSRSRAAATGPRSRGSSCRRGSGSPARARSRERPVCSRRRTSPSPRSTAGDDAHAAIGGLLAGLAIAFDAANALFLFAPAAGVCSRASRQGCARLRESRCCPRVVARRALAVPRPRTRAARRGGDRPAPPRAPAAGVPRRVLQRPPRRSCVRRPASSASHGARWPKSAFVAGWFLPYLLVRGSAASASFGTGGWFGALMPAFPAFVIGVCSLPLLVPRLGERLSRVRELRRRPRASGAVGRGGCGAVAVVPILVVAALPLQKQPVLVASRRIARSCRSSAASRRPREREPGTVYLQWPAAKTPAGRQPFYVVYRSPASVPDGLVCTPRRRRALRARDAAARQHVRPLVLGHRAARPRGRVDVPDRRRSQLRGATRRQRADAPLASGRRDSPGQMTLVGVDAVAVGARVTGAARVLVNLLARLPAADPELEYVAFVTAAGEETLRSRAPDVRVRVVTPRSGLAWELRGAGAGGRRGRRRPALHRARARAARRASDARARVRAARVPAARVRHSERRRGSPLREGRRAPPRVPALAAAGARASRPGRGRRPRGCARTRGVDADVVLPGIDPVFLETEPRAAGRPTVRVPPRVGRPARQHRPRPAGGARACGSSWRARPSSCASASRGSAAELGVDLELAGLGQRRAVARAVPRRRRRSRTRRSTRPTRGCPCSRRWRSGRPPSCSTRRARRRPSRGVGIVVPTRGSASCSQRRSRACATTPALRAELSARGRDARARPRRGRRPRRASRPRSGRRSPCRRLLEEPDDAVVHVRERVALRDDLPPPRAELRA